MVSTSQAATRRPPLAVRVVVVLAAAWLVWTLVDVLAPLLGADANADRPGHAVRAVLTALLAVPLIVLARRYLDRRPVAGLGLHGWRRWLPVGVGFWVGAAALGTALTLLLGWACVTAVPGVDRLAGVLPAGAALEALPEELLFRGYFYRNLAAAMPRWAAVVGQAVLFTAWGALIGAAASVDRLVLLFTFALTLGALRVVTGSLWAPIGFHLVFQWVAQYLAATARWSSTGGRTWS